MANVFSEIVKVLADDVVIVQNRFKFSQELGISGASIQQLLNNYIQGVVTNYDLIYGILGEWVQLKGNSATVGELQRILKANYWNFCSGKLSHIERLQPGPIIFPDASTSAKSKVEEIPINTQLAPTIEPFGFGNVVKNFSGREEDISKLTEYFHSDDCPFVLLTGLGGIGKTQLATKFALGLATSTAVENNSSHTPNKRKTEKDNSQIIKSWLAGENALTLQKSITKFSKHLDIPLKDSENNPFKLKKLLKEIMKKLKSTRDLYKWLVIIDNVDEMYNEFESAAKTLHSFDTHIFILVTSRNRDIFPGEVKHFPLQQLETSSSVQFVKKSLEINNRSSDEFILELCKQLGNFPLALRQAAAYIKQQQTLSLKGDNYSVEDYLEELQKQDTLGLDKECKLSEYSWPTMKVWNITFEKLKTSCGDRGHRALKLLDVLSFLDPDGSDETDTDALFNMFINFYGTENWQDFQKCLELLQQYSLINTNGDQFFCVVTIHRLVQLVVRRKMNLDDSSKEAELLIKFWANFEPEFIIEEQLDNLHNIWRHSSNLHNLDGIRASVVHDLFDVLREFYGNSADSYQFAAEGSELLLRLFGKESVRYLSMQRRLVMCTGEFFASQSVIEKLFSLYDKLTLRAGETHIKTLSAGNCINEALYRLGREEESKEWCQRLRRRLSIINGQEDAAIMKIKNQVSDRLGSMGGTNEAVGMFAEIHKWVKFNLGQFAGLDYLMDRRYEFAEFLFKEQRYAEADVKLREINTLEEYHKKPELALIAKERLAVTMKNVGEVDRALSLMQQVATEWEKLEGPQYCATVRAQKYVTRFRQKLTKSVSGSCKNTDIVL